MGRWLVAALGAVAVGSAIAVWLGDRQSGSGAPVVPDDWFVAVVTADAGDVVEGVPRLPESHAILDGRGGWILAGQMGVLRFDHDGRVDPAWRAARIGKGVSRLERVGSRAIAMLDSPSRPGIAAFEITTGKLLWKTSDGVDFDDLRREMVVTSNRVIVARGPGYPYDGRVDWRSYDIETGSSAPWRPATAEAGIRGYKVVSALAAVGDTLYVAGDPIGDDARLRSEVVGYDLRSGHVSWRSEVGRGWVADFGILLLDDLVITNGSHGSSAYDRQTGRERPVPPWLPVGAWTFEHGDRLYLGADIQFNFREIDGHPRNNLAALSLPSHELLPWAPDLDRFVNVDNILPAGDRVLITGWFTDSIG